MNGPVTNRALACFALFLLLSTACGVPRTAIPIPAGADPGDACVPRGRWLEPASGAIATTSSLLPRIAKNRVVLLGEAHDHLEHHAWQLQTLAALGALHNDLVIGFEMLPRQTRADLDRWVAGDLDEAAFLDAVDWHHAWSLPADLYLPLFRFARLNRFPAIPLNVDRSLVTRVGDVGWDAVPRDEREGIGDPAPPSEEYRQWLTDVYNDHVDEESPIDPTGIDRFTDAQLLWDRAFAEGIATALEQHPGAIVVGILGGGHVQHRWGVPHQLAALGIDDVAVLLPWDEGADCEKLTPDLADAVFGITDFGTTVARGTPLGVLLAEDERGVRVLAVSPASVAAEAGLEEGDIIHTAAGRGVESGADLQEIVQRQAPGTLLPLRVFRGDETLEVLARFPDESR